jgi:hypothetical protein
MKHCWIFLGAILLGGCAAVPPPKIQRADFARSIWSDSQRQAGVLFQDGAQSTPVEGGSLWTFGDTFLGRPAAGQMPDRSQIKGATGTTIALLPTGETNLPPRLKYFAGPDGLATNPLALFPEEPAATNRMWPLGAIAVGSRSYLYYSMIEKTDGPGPWNFHGIGGGLAVSGQPLQPFTRLRPDGHWKFPIEPIQIVREGPLLYLFEISSAPKGLILARVNADEIEKPAAYQFFTRHSWSTNRAQVTVVLREAYGQVSVVWSPTRHRYLMATSSDFFHPREIQLRESASIEGPWSRPARIAVPDMPGKTTKLIYGAFLHPELSDDHAGHFLVTYCRMLAGEWELTNPEWVSLTLAP